MSDTAPCYVVMADVGACAACVVEGSPPQMVAKFLRANKSSTIELVTVERARALLAEYVAHKKWKKTANDVSPTLI